MKLKADYIVIFYIRMPPTRGHDLKLMLISGAWILLEMPPTRGHDLKPPEGGPWAGWHLMPPTRGHDLKLLMNVKTAATS